MNALVITALCLAAWPAWQYARNIRRYRPPTKVDDTDMGSSQGAGRGPGVSILIPARNEESVIAAAVEAALASRGVDLEVIVLDDGSEDRTAAIVAEIARRDPGVRLISGQTPPPGWAGKQFACFTLAQQATREHLLFIDADVRLSPAAAQRLIAFLHATECGLVSGVPRQETVTIFERLLIPLIHFILLGYLPMGRMRQLRLPALGAGCGQLFLTTAAAYRQAGGHEAVKHSFHDGVQLPRAYRRAGLWTDLCDATDLANCRMYRSAGEVWHGLAKNASEGIGSAAGIVPWTVLLVGGHVVPVVLITIAPELTAWQLSAVLAALLHSFAPRFDAARRFHQPWLGAVLHPVGITMMVMIQWLALFRRLIGQPVSWKGRPQPTQVTVRSSEVRFQEP